MTKATIQPFCIANKVNLRCYDGIRVSPRSVTDRNNTLFLQNNHFCLIWKSECVSFNQTIRELKENLKIVDNYITEENVISHFEYDFIPKKTESTESKLNLTNFIVYHLETHITDRARPCIMTFYRLSKLAGKQDRELTPYEIEKCKKDTLVFDGDNCVSYALDFPLKYKGQKQKVKTKLLNIIYKHILIMDRDVILG